MFRETFEWSIPGPVPTRARFEAALACAVNDTFVLGAPGSGVSLDFTEVRETAEGLEGTLRVREGERLWGHPLRIAPEAAREPVRYDVWPLVLSVPIIEDGEERDGEAAPLSRHHLVAGLNRHTLVFASSLAHELIRVCGDHGRLWVEQVPLRADSARVAWVAMHRAADGTFWAAGVSRDEERSRVAYGDMVFSWSSVPLIAENGDSLGAPIAVFGCHAKRGVVVGESGMIAIIGGERVEPVDSSLREAGETIQAAVGYVHDPMEEAALELWLATPRAIFSWEDRGRSPPREVVAWGRHDAAVALAVGEKGALWAASSNEIMRVDAGRIDVALRLDFAPGERGFTGLACGPDGSLWAATATRGLLHLDGGRAEWLALPEPRRPWESDHVGIFVPDAGRAFFVLPSGACVVDRHGLASHTVEVDGCMDDKEDEVFLAFVDELMAAVGGVAPRYQARLSRRLNGNEVLNEPGWNEAEHDSDS